MKNRKGILSKVLKHVYSCLEIILGFPFFAKGINRRHKSQIHGKDHENEAYNGICCLVLVYQLELPE